MFLDLHCAENVSDPISTHEQGIRNQLPVTSPENSFRTTIDGRLFVEELDEFSDRGGECWSLHVIRIGAKANVLPRGVQRRVFDRFSKSSETLHMNVIDSCARQGILQAL